MYSKRAIIGIIVGGIIAGIGVYSLLMSFGIQTIQVDDTLDVGQSDTYTLTAPANTKQIMNVTDCFVS